jgi:small subunit ribosomal protein S17e
MKEYKEEFGTDFEENKKKVGLLTDVESKSMRNKIAGYIARCVKYSLKETV